MEFLSSVSGSLLELGGPDWNPEEGKVVVLLLIVVVVLDVIVVEVVEIVKEPGKNIFSDSPSTDIECSIPKFALNLCACN